MSSDIFDLEAGALCLDLANTVEWHASEHPDDILNDFSDLIAWGEAAGVMPAEGAGRLRRLADRHPENASDAFNRAIRLREAIYRIFADQAREKGANQDDLATLNETLSQAMSHLQVSHSSQGFNWDWVETQDEFDRILWSAARSAGELLTSDKLDRVSECADDRGCGYLFVDMSRNRSRRWCSMDACGNRAKAARNYERLRISQVEEA